jgi:fatty acid desaturase
MDFTTPQAALALLALLAVKHFICDGPLQTLAMVRGKAIYGNRLVLLHAAIHACATLFILFFAGLPPALALGIAAAECVVHYHIDFAKEELLRRMQWTQAQPQFWWTLVGDQALHYLSYIAAAMFIVSN